MTVVGTPTLAKNKEEVPRSRNEQRGIIQGWNDLRRLLWRGDTHSETHRRRGRGGLQRGNEGC